MVGLDGKGCTLPDEVEMADGLVNGEMFSVEGEVSPFILKEFAAEEIQRAFLAWGDVFQNSTNDSTADLCGDDERFPGKWKSKESCCGERVFCFLESIC